MKESLTNTVLEIVKNLVSKTFSIFKALLRLCLLTLTFFIECLDGIFFSSREICGYDIYFKPQNCDEEKISYISKLNNQMGIQQSPQIINIEDLEEFDENE